MPSTTVWGEHSVGQDSHVPLYRQIELAISRLIDGGEVGPQTILPSEARMAELYGVSRLTVRQAVSELRRKGLVESRQGKGTFVASAGLEDVSCLSSFTENALRAGRLPESQMIFFGEVVDAEMAQRLNLDKSTPMILATRLRRLDGAPVYLSFAHIPTDFGRSLREADFPEIGLQQSLYQTLERCCELRLSNGEETVSATLATKKVAELLGVKYRTPLVERTCTMRIADGSAVVAERTLWARSQNSSVRLVWNGTR